MRAFIFFQVKILLFFAFGVFSKGSQAQVQNQLTLTGTGAYSSSFSPAYEGGVLLGLRSNEHSDFRLGLMYRQLLVAVDHPSSYVSLVAMGSRQLFGKFGFHVQGELRQGSYLMTDNFDNSTSVQKMINLFGNMGINFQLNDRVQLLTSYVFQDYDPKGFLIKQKNPHDAGALKFGLNYTLPLALTFNSRSYDP